LRGVGDLACEQLGGARPFGFVWICGGAQALPLRNVSVDAVISDFGLVFLELRIDLRRRPPKRLSLRRFASSFVRFAQVPRPMTARSGCRWGAPRRRGRVGVGFVPYPVFIVYVMDEHVCPEELLGQALNILDRLGAVRLRGRSIPELRGLSGLAGRLKTSAESLLCRIAAEVSASGTAATAAGVLQKTTNMSKRDARRVAAVADGLAGLPNVAERLACGDLTLEHAASLVDTARQTGAEAVDNNTGLLERAGRTPADLFARDARRFAARVVEDKGESVLRRQRKTRRASCFVDSETGMGRLSGHFDPVSFGLIRQAVDNFTDLLWRTDNAANDHTSGELNSGELTGSGFNSGGRIGGGRTAAQRRADAIFELLTGRRARNHEPIAGDGTARNGGAHGCTQLVVVADIGVVDGSNPAGRCEIPGTGPVPPSVLARLSPDAKLAGMIFAGKGRALWLGRSRRLANLAQHLAVTVRDSGCVQCGAPMHQCDIHHVRGWEHGGPTDIDNLAALCRQHHRQHHGPHKHHTHQRPDKRPEHTSPNRSRSGSRSRADP